MNSTVHSVGTVLRIGYRMYTERTVQNLRNELQYVHTANYRNAPSVLSITVEISTGFVQYSFSTHQCSHRVSPAPHYQVAETKTNEMIAGSV
jgi:hypothetical protein